MFIKTLSVRPFYAREVVGEQAAPAAAVEVVIVYAPWVMARLALELVAEQAGARGAPGEPRLARRLFLVDERHHAFAQPLPELRCKVFVYDE